MYIAVHAYQAVPIRPGLLDLVHEAGSCKGYQRHFKVNTGEFLLHLQNVGKSSICYK